MKNLIYIFIVTILLAISTSICSAGITNFVWKSSATPSFPYTTWATAAHTIQEAIDSSVDGNIVLVTNGIYSTPNRSAPGCIHTNIITITNKIMVMSVNGFEKTFIVGAPSADTFYDGLGDDAIRCSYLTNGAILSGFTLSNGFASHPFTNPITERQGGGSFLDHGGIITNCKIIACKASNGGGAYCFHGGKILNSEILHNNSSSGAGIANVANSVDYKTEVLIKNCKIKYNCSFLKHCSNQNGGGIVGGNIDSCLIEYNSSSNHAGGVEGGVLTNCVIRNNYAQWDAGGIIFYNYYDLAIDCVIKNNEAGRNGGGAYLTGGILDSCFIKENTAGADGGGIQMRDWDCKARSSLIIDNSCNGYGGGVYAENNSKIENCTIVKNNANLGGGICCTNAAYVYNSIIYDNATGGNYHNSSVDNDYLHCCTTPGISGTGNLTADPQFKNPTVENYQLPLSSPCVNTGSNDIWMSEKTDLSGNPRIMGNNVDIGAYEYLQIIVKDITNANPVEFDFDNSSVTIEPQTSGGSITVSRYFSPPIPPPSFLSTTDVWYYISGTDYSGGFPVEITILWDAPIPSDVLSLGWTTNEGNGWVDANSDPDITGLNWSTSAAPYSVSFNVPHMSHWTIGNFIPEPFPFWILYFGVWIRFSARRILS